MKRLLLIIIFFIILGFSTATNASLHDRGGGLIYDSSLDVTWLQDAHYYFTSGHSVHDEDLTYWGARYWAEFLIYYDSIRDVTWSDCWRLPKASIDETYPSQGYDIINSEMGHLFYESLGNQSGSLQNSGPFINIQPGKYWYNEEHIYGQPFEERFYFDWSNGYQGVTPARQGDRNYVMVLMDGDVGPIPIPTTIFLLGSGLIGIVGIRKKFKG